MTTENTNTGVLENAYHKLFQSGILAQVHISKWSMATKMSTADLKIDKEIPEGLFQLGKKLLMPAEEKNKFDRIEGKARRILDSYAFDFPIAQAHFVPMTNIVKAMQELNDVKEEFYKLVNEFLDNYEQLKADMLAKYPNYSDVIEPYYPPVEKIRSKFAFSVSQFQIDFPKELKETNIEQILREQGAKQEVIEEYRAQMREQYEQALGTMHTFVNDSVKTLRDEASKACAYVYQKISNNEPVTRTNINTITEMIANFESMNFFNDNVVSQQLADLKRVVTSDGDFRNDEDAISTLSTALKAVVDKVTSEQDVSSLTNSFFRAIEV